MQSDNDKIRKVLLNNADQNKPPISVISKAEEYLEKKKIKHKHRFGIIAVAITPFLVIIIAISILLPPLLHKENIVSPPLSSELQYNYSALYVSSNAQDYGLLTLDLPNSEKQIYDYKFIASDEVAFTCSKIRAVTEYGLLWVIISAENEGYKGEMFKIDYNDRDEYNEKNYFKKTKFENGEYYKYYFYTIDGIKYYITMYAPNDFGEKYIQMILDSGTNNP